MRRVVLAAMVALWAQGARAEILIGADDPGCREAVAVSDPRRGASVLVLKDGKPTCEAYAGQGGPDVRLELWSGTKSFSGIMAAAAVQDGLLTLDEPVSKTLPEWRDDPRKAKATIRNLLNLSVGIKSSIGRAPDYAEAVALPLEADPGEKFAYGAGPYQVWGAVMARKLAAAGQPADPYLYLKRRILDPLGMGGVVWRRTPAGDPMMPQGAVMTAREWARFGEFVRAGGKAGGKQLVDPATFRQLFQSSTANPAYGLTWWLPHAAPPTDAVGSRQDLGEHAAGFPADLVMAAGAGDQRLYVIPSKKLVIVRQASFALRDAIAERRSGRVWSDTDFLRAVLSGAAGR